jgi:Arc/MetJ-type ribon-helix-helix transcriptional regulator
METMQVPLTDSLRGFVENQAAKRGFSSPADFVQSVLLGLEKHAKAKKDLEDKLLEGVRSPMIEADEKFWRELEYSLLEQFPELKSCDD